MFLKSFKNNFIHVIFCAVKSHLIDFSVFLYEIIQNNQSSKDKMTLLFVCHAELVSASQTILFGDFSVVKITTFIL
ncbi:MAG: hypothetical protein H6609_00445 [Ignavibacteriales bacterium]|nr:hypothetical protein [Ignavibacteriales bacterium]